MKQKIKTIISIFLLLLIFSCEKYNLGDCFKNTGKIISEERSLSEFSSILLKDNINLILTYGNEQSIIVEAGKNLMSSIHTEVNDKQLTISNTSSCNWVRSYDKPINLYLTFNILDSIIYRSSGDITCTNTLECDTLLIQVMEGCGSINLDLNTQKVFLKEIYGTVDFTLKGKTFTSYIYSAGYGPFNCRELETRNTFVVNQSTNDFYVKASDILEATIDNLGNVYYSGNPAKICSTITGEGRLIKLD